MKQNNYFGAILLLSFSFLFTNCNNKNAKTSAHANLEEAKKAIADEL